MYSQPRRAKRLHFDVIPKTVDEYYQHLGKLSTQEDAALVENPVWHIHSGSPSLSVLPVSFTLLLNLAAVCHAEAPDIVWGYVIEYAPDVSPASHPELDRMIVYAVNYYQDMVRPHKIYRVPNEIEQSHLQALKNAVADLPDHASGEDIQSVVYAVGKLPNMKICEIGLSVCMKCSLARLKGLEWDRSSLYGRDKSVQLIEDAMTGRLSASDSAAS